MSTTCLLFADDTFVQKVNKSLPNLIKSMKKKMEAISKKLKKSGLVVNETNTELCLFHRNDVAPI
jgi:histidinol dehydrogenase